jgi:hypothetical protein
MNMSLRIALSRLLVTGCVLVFCSVSWAVEASKRLPAEKFEIDPNRTEQVISNIDHLLNQIDRSQFDIDALIERLSFDENEIIQFVSREISFEKYPGTLRGAAGTLRSRAGNSLDQAILLAKMLNDIALEARIVEGEMPHAELVKLLLKTRSDIPGVFVGQAGLLKIASELNQGSLISSSKTNNMPPEPVNGKVKFVLPKDVSDIVSEIQAAIKEEHIVFGKKPVVNVKNGVPYFWVEYRDQPSRLWEPIHPAFGGNLSSGTAVKALRYFTKMIDADLQHKIKVQAFIDRSWNGRKETIAVTPAHEYPAANLSGLTFSYSVKPISSLFTKIESQEDARNAVETSNMFIPVFDFGKKRPKLAFDTSGNVLPVEEAISAMAPLFQQVGKRFGSAADVLATNGAPSTDDSDPNRYIVRHWLKFTISQPGLQPKVITRDLAHWNGNASLFKRSLAREANFLVETGAVSPALFLDHRLNTLKRTVQSFLSGEPFEIQSDKQQNFLLDAEVFLLSSDEIVRQNSTAILYRAEPTIVARYFPFGFINPGQEGFDILSIPRHAISASTGKTDVAAVLQAGITDTWLEHKLFAGEYWQQNSAYGRLLSHINTGGAFTVLSQNNRVLTKDIPLQSQAVINQSLDNNDLIILVGEAKQCDSWWRINPASGESLGMLSNGWGGVEGTEYLADLTAIYGGVKVGGAMLSCGAAIAGLRASVGLAALRLFEVDETLGFQNLNLCANIPSPTLQALCTGIVAGAAAASQAPISTLSNEALMTLCLKFIFS